MSHRPPDDNDATWTLIFIFVGWLLAGFMLLYGFTNGFAG